MRLLLLLALLLATPALAWSTPRPVVGDYRKIVAERDQSLQTMARHHGLSVEHLAQANGLGLSDSVSKGTSVVLPSMRILPTNPPKDGLVVNLPEGGAYLFKGGRFVKFYPIAIGEPGRFATPTGNYEIISLEKDPPWNVPTWAQKKMKAKVIPPGHPKNPIGAYWIGISVPGVGFHSTEMLATVGESASHGCMRMYPEGIKDLFSRLEKGMPVRIVYETVKLGQTPEGKTMLAVYPDPYGMAKPRLRLERALKAAGIQSWVDDARVTSLLERKTGVAAVVLAPAGSAVLDGKSVALKQPLVKRDGQLYFPAELARKLGIDVAAAKGKVTLRRSGRSLVVNQDLLGNHSMLPAGKVLKAFGFGYTWDAKDRRLQIASAGR